MKKLFNAEIIEASALAIPVIIGGIWWVFGVSSIASEALAKVNSLTPMVQEIHDTLLVIKTDLQYLKKQKDKE